MRILIQNGTLITFGSPCRVLEGQALLLEDGRIARIAPAEEIPGPFDRVLDARGKLVLPGLVNAHMHFYSTLVRGLGQGRAERQLPGGPREPLVAPRPEALPRRRRDERPGSS